MWATIPAHGTDTLYPVTSQALVWLHSTLMVMLLLVVIFKKLLTLLSENHRLALWSCPNVLEDDDLDTTTRVLIIEDLSSDFDVVYERAGGDQTVSMEYDNPDSGVSLDESTYSRNTVVEATIDDMALNVDPTDGDAWYFDSVLGKAIYAGTGLTEAQLDILRGRRQRGC